MSETGVVVEALRGIKFKVKFQNDTIICYVSGKMQKNNITVLVGDKVDVTGIPHDRSNGRIIKRI